MNRWSSLWPTLSELQRVMIDPELLYPVPGGAQPWRITPDTVREMMVDNAWMLWIMNPSLDHLVLPKGVEPRHWVNMALTPIHAPCRMAIRALGPAMLHRIRCGEVVQSHRPRYISSAAYAVDDTY